MAETLSLKNKTDEELMVLYCQNEIKAFDELFSRHSGKVYGYIFKKVKTETLAQDLTQIAFLKLHEHRHKYLSDHPFLSWFFVIIRNSIIDEIRKLKPQEQYEDTQSALTDIELSWDAKDVIGQAPEPYRQALHLRYIEEAEFEEIAKQLNISPDNARQKVSRGLKFLKTFLKKDSL